MTSGKCPGCETLIVSFRVKISLGTTYQSHFPGHCCLLCLAFLVDMHGGGLCLHSLGEHGVFLFPDLVRHRRLGSTMKAYHARSLAGVRFIAYWLFLWTFIASTGLRRSPAQETSDAWKTLLQQQVKKGDLEAAQQIAEQRIAKDESDLEAHGWRARLLAWRGAWSQAESEYRLVLAQSPNDSDLLAGLADVVLWQRRPREALHVLDQACSLNPNETEILLRHARVLSLLGRSREARTEFRRILALDPSDEEAQKGLRALSDLGRHEFRLGADFETFNYTDAAQTFALGIRSRWTERWFTSFATSAYQRFGESATRFSASAGYRFAANDWLTLGGAVARDQGVIPRSEAFFEYGHGFRIRKSWIRGVESSYQQRWLWFREAKVLTLNSTQLFYLPKDWTWTMSGTGALSRFTGREGEWRPSGMVKLGFPLRHRLTGNTFFAVGSENFALADQIGSFSARTYGGGLRFRMTSSQDFDGYIAKQDRSTGRTQTSFGVSYGFRF